MQEVKGNIAERVASAFNDRDPRMKRWACMSAERRRQYVLRWERRLQAIRDAGFEVVEVAEVERLTRERDEARAALRWYADHRNHFPVLDHRRAGDPDPVAVFFEEPPIMSDGGGRAREALEGKQ